MPPADIYSRSSTPSTSDAAREQVREMSPPTLLPWGATAAPVRAEAAPDLAASLVGNISELLLTQYKSGELPSWWDNIRPILTKLLDLGLRVTAYPTASIVWKRYEHINSHRQLFNPIKQEIQNQLLRSTREICLRQCIVAHLALFLGVLDAWLRACEEYLLNVSITFPFKVTQFQVLYRQLESIASLHPTTVVYTFDNLIHLFHHLEQA
jgi:hypothetical protein